MKQSILLLSALITSIAVIGAGAANAALVHDFVAFSASGFTAIVGSDPAPVDPVTGTFTITFDTAQSYFDETTGITLHSLNISLDSALSFSYSPSGVGLNGTLVVGGIEATSAQVDISSNDFYLYIDNYATAPAIDQVGYSQTSVSDANFFHAFGTGGTGSVTVTPVTPVPEPATWAMMLTGFAALGFFGYCQTAKTRVAA